MWHKKLGGSSQISTHDQWNHVSHLSQPIHFSTSSVSSWYVCVIAWGHSQADLIQLYSWPFCRRVLTPFSTPRLQLDTFRCLIHSSISSGGSNTSAMLSVQNGSYSIPTTKEQVSLPHCARLAEKSRLQPAQALPERLWLNRPCWWDATLMRSSQRVKSRH